MRNVTLVAAVLAVACLGGPALASDLLYRHDRFQGPDLLEGSNGRPYWVLMSECAGFYGAMANMASSEADYENDVAMARQWLNRAIMRLVADRGLERPEAIALIEPRISRARTVGEASIAASGGDDVNALTLTATQIMRSTCGSLGRVYATQTG